jgi:hypothetical protein
MWRTIRYAAAAAAIVLAVPCASVAADEPFDFGVPALQRAKASYVAGDSAAARRHVDEATGVLVNAAGRMQSPGSGEVWTLVNDLRLLRLVPGDGSAAALQDLSAAATRAGTLAERYPDAFAAPLENRR